MNNESPNKKGIIEMSGFFLQFSLGIVLGFYAGNILDRKYNTSPWFAAAGIFLGILMGFAHLLLWVNKNTK